MKSSGLWNKMWSESSFVPVDPVEKIDRMMGEETVMDKVSKLERRIQVLENRLNRFGKI
tara:strand:+ start:795 stop:971 length:177 start_codon:yes stop_codon:yes gene_type:complete